MAKGWSIVYILFIGTLQILNILSVHNSSTSKIFATSLVLKGESFCLVKNKRSFPGYFSDEQEECKCLPFRRPQIKSTTIESFLSNSSLASVISCIHDHGEISLVFSLETYHCASKWGREPGHKIDSDPRTLPSVSMMMHCSISGHFQQLLLM